MTRPWRLTRRQRVEMEAALSVLRVGIVRRRVERPQIAHARACAGGPGMFTIDGYVHLDEPRTLRARVAIALRAALRADEDTRCEEARVEVESADDRHDPEVRAWNDGAHTAIDAVRAWPPVRYVSHPTATVRAADLWGWPQDHPHADMRVPALVVPLALWERMPHPSLWAQSPPTSDPRGPR